MGGSPQLRLLLDTHIWLWSRLEPDRLGQGLAKRLRDRETELWLSPISIWEAMLLIEKGRVEVVGDPGHWMRHALRTWPHRDATLTREVALMSRTVDLPHQDPADRFIAASAVVHELTLTTADARLLSCRQFGSLPNR